MKQLLPLALVAPVLLACACASSSPSESREGAVKSASSAVIKGKNSDASQDAVVLLVHYDPAQQGVASCTGTLLAPNLILTARHCVADTDESAACDIDGRPLASGVVRGNHPANTLYVFTGPKRPDFYQGNVSPAGVGAKILDDGAKNLCNHDIALVVLQKPVVGASIAKIRLDAAIEKTDVLTAIGWGVTDKSPDPDVRQQRSGIKILEIGPDDTNGFPVPPNEFQVGESICSGDSGGPAIAETGAIVGVVSRGGNQTQPNPRDPSSSCIGASAENLYTKVAPFRDFIMKGFEAANAEPWLEGGPDPRLAKDGEPCDTAEACRSNQCIPVDPNFPEAARRCIASCLVDACPDGLVCTPYGEAQLCMAAPPAAAPTTTAKSSSGCATSRSGPLPGNTTVFGLGLGLAALVLGRRRRDA